MSLRRSIRNLLVPIVGDERLIRIGRAERRWRHALADRIEPPTGRRAVSPRADRARSPQAGKQRPAGVRGTAQRKRPAPPAPARQAARSKSAPARSTGDPTEPGAPGKMTYLDVLELLHRRLEPRTYLEIGVSKGRSIALSSARTIGVDPHLQVTDPVGEHVRLVQMTSDDFFASPDPVAHFGGTPVDLAFIDGLHLAEFAYRDFMNVERLCSPTSVIVVDDVLPRSTEEAARTRVTSAWAGDVYKVIEILRRRRPDLVIVPVDARPTGVAIIAGLDPGSSVLADIYSEVLSELESPDPQHVPRHVLDRDRAADPTALTERPVWARLRELRDVADRETVSKELAELT